MHIAVIGAGPSGSRTAARLAAGGHEVSLVDRSFDREKPCGGGVPGAGLRLLRDGERGFVVRTLALEAPSGARATTDLPGPLAVFSRRLLDRSLLDRAALAGARLVHETVTDVARSSSGTWRVRLGGGGLLEADHLVGADGVRSRVRREVCGPFPAQDLSQAVGWIVPGRLTDVMTIRFDARIDGYLWIFPRPDHLAVGACAPLGDGIAETLWATGRALLREGLGISDKGLARHSALIPTLGVASLGEHRVCGDGWSLVGDAAGSVDPLTREGIRHGLVSADLLADAFAREQPGSYDAFWKTRFSPDFSWAAAHRKRFFAPETTERFVRYTGRSRALRKVLTDLVMGEQDYLSLRRRLVRTALPFGAELLMSQAKRVLRGAHP